MAADGVYLERDERVAPVHHQTTGREPVYVLANTRERAASWARQNKPGMLPKCFSAASVLGPRGLYIPDVPVFVVDEIPQHVREAWAPTGCKLVYL